MFAFRVYDGSDKRLNLAKVYTNNSIRVSLICLMLNSNVKNDLTLVVQTDSWAADFTCAKSFCVIRKC